MTAYQTAEDAIKFSLTLPAYEVQEYLAGWSARRDLSPWTHAAEYDHRFAAGEPLEDIRHLIGA